MVSTTSLDFLAGGSNISCLNITILEDEAFEGNHTFTVNVQEVTLPSGETDALLMAGAASATVTIQDNEGNTDAKLKPVQMMIMCCCEFVFARPCNSLD